MAYNAQKSMDLMKAGSKVDLDSLLKEASGITGKIVKEVTEEAAEEVAENAKMGDNAKVRTKKKGENVEGGSKTIITPEMEEKILLGQRKNPAKNELIGGHSPDINNTNLNYVVEVLQTNPDGTQKIKFVTQYADGNLSNIKTSTIFQIAGVMIK